MRYRLRTLLVVLALGPALLAVAWFALTAPPDTKGIIRDNGDGTETIIRRNRWGGFHQEIRPSLTDAPTTNTAPQSPK